MKMIRTFLRGVNIAAFAALSSLPLSASAAGVVIDFGTGLAGAGGSLVETNGDVVGTDILIGVLDANNTSADGQYQVTDGLLNFDTAADVITIEGSIAGLSISNQVLLSGSFASFTYDASNLYVTSFSGTGPDSKSEDLLTALGVPLETNFDFFGFTIESSLLGEVVSTDIVNSEVGGVAPPIPVPAAAWLFGSALLGLIAVKRRKA